MPTIPAARTPRILEVLSELIQQNFAKQAQRSTPSYPGPRNGSPTIRSLSFWSFEINDEIDILLSREEVVGDYKWDHPNYQQARWSTLPIRVERRMIESEHAPFRQWRESVPPGNPRQLSREILFRASRPCPPDTASIWRGVEFIGAVDRYGAYTKPYDWQSQGHTEVEFIAALASLLESLRTCISRT